MKTLKVTTRNSVYLVSEDDAGQRRVTDILIPNGGNYRDVHYFIKDRAPEVTSGPTIGECMRGGVKFNDTWHTSTVLAIEEVPVVGDDQQ